MCACVHFCASRLRKISPIWVTKLAKLVNVQRNLLEVVTSMNIESHSGMGEVWNSTDGQSLGIRSYEIRVTEERHGGLKRITGTIEFSDQEAFDLSFTTDSQVILQLETDEKLSCLMDGKGIANASPLKDF
jgi:hypothetical protein